MAVEGRDLGLGRALAGASGAGIVDETSNAAEGREASKGAACESEGSSRLPVLLAERQGVARRCDGHRLAGSPPQSRRCRGGRRDGCGHRGVRRRPVAWGAGAGPEGWDLPGGCSTAGSNSQEAAWEVSAPGHSLRTGPGGADGGDAGVIADLRGRPATGAVRLSTGPERERCRQARASAAEHGPSRGG